MKGRKCAVPVPMAGVVGPHCITFTGWSWDPGGKHSAGRPQAWGRSGMAHAGRCPPCMAPLLTWPDCSLAHSHRRLGLKPPPQKATHWGFPLPRGSHMPQKEPTSSQDTPSIWSSVSEQLTWSFAFPFPCNRKCLPVLGAEVWKPPVF